MAGSGRKEEKAMSVELAIQRELAFRKIVAAFHLRPNTNSTEEILPLQVKSSNQDSQSMPLLGPSSRQFSSPCLSGTKRKEPPSNAHHHHQTFHGSLNHKAKTDNLYCRICQVTCLSPFNLKQHLTGHKHREKLQELEFSEKDGREGRSNQRHWCEMCKVSCMNEDLLKLHFQGKKHKAEFLKLEINKKGGEAPNMQKWCGLCKLWCIDEFAFKQHLEGKKHIIRLYVMEKEKERWGCDTSIRPDMGSGGLGSSGMVREPPTQTKETEQREKAGGGQRKGERVRMSSKWTRDFLMG